MKRVFILLLLTVPSIALCGEEKQVPRYKDGSLAKISASNVVIASTRSPRGGTSPRTASPRGSSLKTSHSALERVKLQDELLKVDPDLLLPSLGK